MFAKSLNLFFGKKKQKKKTKLMQNDQSTNNNRPANNTGTMWNWFTQNKLVNTFVEKAKVFVCFFIF